MLCAYVLHDGSGPLNTYDTATCHFLKFDMRHGALVTRREGEIQSKVTCDIMALDP